MFKKLAFYIIITIVVVSLSVYSSKQVSTINTSSKIKISDTAFKIKTLKKASKMKTSDSFNDIRAIPLTNTDKQLDKNVRQLSGDDDYPNTTHLILGSIEYVQAINNIAKEYGNQTAFSAIMIDVDQNGSELDNNNPNNISRFKKLVSSLIYKIGYVDMQDHYFKNKLNRDS